MSELQMRQIEATLTTKFSGCIDVADSVGLAPKEKNNVFLTRALAAYSLMYLTDVPLDEACASITDGYNDNGIDAICYQRDERTLYVVQSKWHANGTGSINSGDMHKFLRGFSDLINGRWSNFNDKVQTRSADLEPALLDGSTQIYLVVVHTGTQSLSPGVQRLLQEEVDRINDTSTLVHTRILTQVEVHQAVQRGVSGAPINVDVMLHDWGQVREPYAAYYGQVSASDVATWYATHQARLLAPNIRVFLGPTQVNAGIVGTLSTDPGNMWYFNNGITALCRTLAKKPLGGSTREIGIFECKDFSIVNGAQTVGAIEAAYNKVPQAVRNARLSLRIIVLDGCPPDFDKEVTRFTNTQNHIDRRDFVALDAEQERIRQELEIDGISYVYKSGEAVRVTATGFDLAEATVAQACQHPDVDYAVLAKREIGRLWEDITRAPYRTLFNGTVTGPTLWSRVQVTRRVESELTQTARSAPDSRQRLLGVHGNRLIAHVVFQLVQAEFGTTAWNTVGDRVGPVTADVFRKMLSVVNNDYSGEYLASVFKNLEKCRSIKTKIGT